MRAYNEKGHAVSTALDFEGRKRTVTDPNGATTAYDYYAATKDGRLKTITYPKIQSFTAGRQVEFDYDFNGNVTTVTEIPAVPSALGSRTTKTFYDELNRPIRLVGPAYTDKTPGPTFDQRRCPVTRNTYDTLGRLTQVDAGYTPAAGGVCDTADVLNAVPQMRYVYDDFGRKLKDIDGLNREWVYQYDINNNLTRVTDPKGQQTNLTYQYGGKLLSSTDHAGRRTTYAYNARGQVLTAQSVEVTYSYTYDAALRLASVNDSRGNKTLAYQYSPGGRLTRMTIDDAGPIDYRYDTTGQLMTIRDGFDSIVSYAYDAVRLKQRFLGNGASAEYAWNADGTLAQLKNTHTNLTTSAQSVVTQHDYTYNNVGFKAQGTDKVGAFTQPAMNESFAYDALNNRTQRTATGVDQRYTFDASNQLTHIRDASAALTGALIYDANGNVTKKCTGASTTTNGTDCTAGNVLTLTFDAANRLSQANGPNGIETYGYDDQGRRIRKSVNGVNTFYLYNGPDIVAEYGEGWSKPTAINLQGPGTDDPIVRYTKNSNGSYDKAYFHADGLGSTVALTTDDGTITAAQMFDAWGNKIPASSIGNVPTYGYTGREPDATGLIYYRARYYDPSIGRFVSQDPIGLAGGLNQYAYVRNNPINFVDPLGLVPADALRVQFADATDLYFKRTMSDASPVGAQSLSTAKYADSDFVCRTPTVACQSAVEYARIQRVDPPMSGSSIGPDDILLAAVSIPLAAVKLVGGAAVFRAGALFEATFQTSKGPVSMLAETSVSGGTLTLKDAVLYGQSAMPLTGMNREIYQGLAILQDAARAQGFNTLEITGTRVLNSTSAVPGRTLNWTFDLSK